MLYFDNASTTYHKSERVKAAVSSALDNLTANAGRGAHASGERCALAIMNAREKVARYFDSDYGDGVIFTYNCTDALNTAILGTARRGHVVTTALEHNSVLRPLFSLQNSVRFTCVSPRENGTVASADIEKAICRDTYMIICNHVSNVTGAVAPINEIGAIAKRHGLLFLVDCAQSAGYMKVSMRDCHADMICFAPHKGLHALQGLGCLVLNRSVQVRPLRFGGTGTFSHSIMQPNGLPESLESGTLPVFSIRALSEAIDENCELQRDKERFETPFHLGRLIRERLSALPFVTVYTPESSIGNIVAFNVDSIPSSTLGAILDERYSIAVRCGLHCAPKAHAFLKTEKSGAVRASLSFGNTLEDADFFVRAVEEISRFRTRR